MAEQQTIPTSEPVVSQPDAVSPVLEDESVEVQVVDSVDDEIEQAPVQEQDAAQAEPVIPPAIQAELDKLRNENKAIQSAKDREVAAAQQSLYQEQQRRVQYEQQIQQWQQQQAAAEAEAQRIKDELEFKEFWDSATPEQQAAYQAAHTYVSNIEQQRRQQADALATQAVQEGIPVDYLKEAVDVDYSPTAVKAAVLMYRQWDEGRRRELAMKLAPLQPKIAEAQRFRTMSPEQREDHIKRMPPERQAVVLRNMAKRGIPVAAVAPAAVAPVATRPQPAPQAPPPTVTPGSTSGTPPSNLSAELDRAIKSGDRRRINEVRMALGKALGVDQTND